MNRNALLLAASAALSSVAWALAQNPPAAVPSATAAPKVTGHVVYDGKPPVVGPLVIDADKSSGCCPDGKPLDLKDPTLVLDEHGGIANCVVTVQVEGAKVEPAKEPLAIDQKGCRFEPHVVLATVGSKVRFLNSDTCTHNVHTYARKSEGINKAMGSGGKEELALEFRETIRVQCDYHPWMSCWIFVSDTPFTALTAADGSFELRGLKPGTYQGEVWHEQLGKQKFELTVNADGSAAPLVLELAFKKKT